MNRLCRRGDGSAARALRRLTGAGLAGAMGLLVGCGGTQLAAQALFREPSEYDHYFFPDLASTEGATDAGAEAIKAEIERLATPAWKIARANVIAAGKDAIPWLIAALDRKDPTYASIRPVPGPTTPEPRGSWTLGQVAYSVLGDLVGDYGTIEGSSLPPPDKGAWEAWWAANRKTLVVYTLAGTIPPHVRKQKEDISAEMERQYPGYSNRGLEARALSVAKAEAARAEKEKERERRLEDRKRKAEEARERADAERAVREAARARRVEAAAKGESETESGSGTEEAPVE